LALSYSLQEEDFNINSASMLDGRASLLSDSSTKVGLLAALSQLQGGSEVGEQLAAHLRYRLAFLEVRSHV
jgi:hypothetical protein